MTVKDKILAKSTDGKITCSTAYSIAVTDNIPPLELGGLLDELNVKLYQCQLGLFGMEEEEGETEECKAA